jgi:hypothetical protein
VPKKYVEKVGDDGFKKAPVGAGPYKVVSFNPGVDLVMEAFEGYWRKTPSVKRLVFRSMPDVQQIMHDRVLHVPVYELAFLWGVGPRVEEACVDHIKGFAYSAPYEDLKLKRGSRSARPDVRELRLAPRALAM